MSWALGKRLIIIAVALIVVLIVGGAIAYFSLNKAPSCIDGIQNRDEDGVDCGGTMCAYLCSASEVLPSVSYARALRNGNRTDVVAYIENNNAAAAKNVPYKVEVYGAGQTLLGGRTGTIDVPPREGVPIFVPGVYVGTSTATDAFVTFDPASIHWYRNNRSRTLPRAGQIQFGGTITAPRIIATVTNPTVTTLRNIPVIVVVHDAAGGVIAASSTVLPMLPGQGTATATFTWNQAFTAPPGVVDIFPVIGL